MSLSTAQTLTTAELGAIGLFAALPNEVLDHLAATLELRSFAAGDIVFHEGDTARDMFAVVSGEMEVLKHSRLGSEARVAVLGPGDWFGEMSIVDVQPRSASVRVLSPSRVVRVTAADFDALYRRDIRAYALIILNLARELSRRLRVADGILADLIANVVDGYLTRR
jgi:CRP/FNR family cyclic AMP-dependent transcriptional regulator